MAPTDKLSFISQNTNPFNSFWNFSNNASFDGNISLFQNYFTQTIQPDFTLSFFQPLNFENPSAFNCSLNETSSNSAVNRALGQIGHKGGQAFGAGNQAWCAAFASWVYGGKNAPWGQQLSVSGIKNWAKNNNKYKSGSSIAGVKPGDLVVWQRDTCGRSHVGIVKEIHNNKIVTVEGNTSGNKVATREYAIGTKFDGFVSV